MSAAARYRALDLIDTLRARAEAADQWRAFALEVALQVAPLGEEQRAAQTTVGDLPALTEALREVVAERDRADSRAARAHAHKVVAESEAVALRARAEAAEAALATARAEGAAALLSDVLALLDKSAAHDRAKAQCISGDDRDALDTRATVTELICTSLAAHFGGPVEGA
jgi:hypothetical protein